MKRIVNALGKLSWGKRAFAIFALCVTTAFALPAQTFTALFSFDGTDGQFPYAGLVQGTDGNLYGTASGGGTVDCPDDNGCGTVFKITPTGTLTTLYSFCSIKACPDGYDPVAGLVQAGNGDFYGTNRNDGGGHDDGTIFKITPSGTLTTLQGFNFTDGDHPAGLVQAANGDFYGTTAEGGTNSLGTIFNMTPSGTLTTLYSFCSQSGCPDGKLPEAALVQASNGNLYGTTAEGGANSLGTIFKITPSGTLTTLHSFAGSPTDGATPDAALVQATNGNLYGTTSGGGTHGQGTVFKITPTGTLTILYSFCSESNCADGELPEASLIQATDGNLYGTTYGGGANSFGTIFKLTPSGALTTLYSFCSQSGCTDGEYPNSGLVQDTNGNFYGTASAGGANNDGTVFSLSVGLGPFVEPRPASGIVGAVVEILGTGLTGATSVSFNGAAALFKVSASSLITTIVPAGATSGEVQVVTPSRTLLSNVPFRVLP